MRIFFKCPFHIADLVKIKMLTLYAHDSFCMSNIAASFILLYVPMILNNVIQSKNIQSWKTVVFSSHLVWKNILRYQRSNDKYSDGLGGYYTIHVSKIWRGRN